MYFCNEVIEGKQARRWSPRVIMLCCGVTTKDLTSVLQLRCGGCVPQELARVRHTSDHPRLLGCATPSSEAGASLSNHLQVRASPSTQGLMRRLHFTAHPQCIRLARQHPLTVELAHGSTSSLLSARLFAHLDSSFPVLLHTISAHYFTCSDSSLLSKLGSTMAVLSSLAFSFFFAIVVFYLLNRSRRRRNERPLPPGPKGVPILGNVNDMPKPGVLECHHWLQHKDLYGPISSVTVLGQTFVIINDSQIAFELMRDRSAIHSSRPHQVFSGDMYVLCASLLVYVAHAQRIDCNQGGMAPRNSHESVRRLVENAEEKHHKGIQHQHIYLCVRPRAGS